MQRKPLVIFAILFTIVGARQALAEELVARATVEDFMLSVFGGNVPMVRITTNREFMGPRSTPDAQSELRRALFTVYTKEEIDSKQTQDAKQISDMQDLIAVLRQNLKTLSDLNDALTKRLDDLEKQVHDSQ